MDHQKQAKQKKAGSVLYYLLLTLLLGVFAVSFFYVADYFLESKQQENRYDELAAIVDAAKDPKPEPVTGDPVTGTPSGDSPNEESDTTQPTENILTILPEYEALHAMNPHMVGWLRIEDTRINYPVMQTPGEPDYYLRRNFDGEHSSQGCIYAEEACDLTAPSDNITLYGHNMNDGSMFACLKNYTVPYFYENHRYIHFDTLTQHHTYEVFAVFTTTASLGRGFSYHSFIDAEDAADFDEFIAQCRSLSLYDTGIIPEYGDKIICLSTCEYTQKNGRLVVAAVLIE